MRELRIKGRGEELSGSSLGYNSGVGECVAAREREAIFLKEELMSFLRKRKMIVSN